MTAPPTVPPGLLISAWLTLINNAYSAQYGQYAGMQVTYITEIRNQNTSSTATPYIS